MCSLLTFLITILGLSCSASPLPSCQMIRFWRLETPDGQTDNLDKTKIRYTTVCHCKTQPPYSDPFVIISSRKRPIEVPCDSSSGHTPLHFYYDLSNIMETCYLMSERWDDSFWTPITENRFIPSLGSTALNRYQMRGFLNGGVRYEDVCPFDN